MRHLLILISFLLLSSPVIGNNHKGETLYRWGEYPDYKWMGFGEKDTHHLYKGQVGNGEPNGQGTETYPNGNKYVGEYKDGKKHGQGTYTWGKGKWEGDKYVGEYMDGGEWNGTIYDKNGNIIDNYVNGVIQ